jgi:integrase
MAYVFQRPAKDGKVRFTAMYKAENGKYRSAGTYDDKDRAQQVADESERHAHLRLAETSPGEKATITVEEFMPKFLREHAIEPNSRQRYAEVLRSHAIPYIGHRRVAEISREAFHRLLTVVLKDEGVGQPTILYARTALSAMMQMAWDHGYRDDNPLRGIRLKGVPGKPIIVATSAQFQRIYDALPHQPAKVFARLGVASGARLCELISFTPEDFDFDTEMLSVNKSTVEVTAEFHPEGHRFLTRSYTKNGGHRRFKIDAVVSEMV